jgi:tRNA-uridine 2-sulfurtransferase
LPKIQFSISKYNMPRVVVGLSGGVDSSVAAFLLKEKGYDIVGIFMKNWHDQTVVINNECPWIDDSNDAMLVAQKLGIPFQVLDLSKPYKERIVDYMFAEYEAGRTPNPDILCNREIKFDVFLEAAEKLNADFVATGHYCQKGEINIGNQIIYRLLAGADKTKDQSYFLCQLTQNQLSKALFPIGHLQKRQVREIASKLDLVTAEKKDSQGLCFVGKIRLPDFLQQQLQPKKGKIVEIDSNADMFLADQDNLDLTNKESLFKIKSEAFKYHFEDGKVIGEHNGAHYYTIGQRKGLNVGGKTEPLFVLEKDVVENIVYTGMGENHPGLNRKGLFVKKKEAHWIRHDLELKLGESKNYLARIRYRQPLEKVEILKTIEGIYFLFENYQKGIASGQFVAWYNEDELIGSGVIT